MKERILEQVVAVTDYAKRVRGYLHENPEVSNQEFATATFLKKEIKQLGLPIEEAQGTGFIAVLDTGKPGKTVALRTDIDALPIIEDEANLKKPKKWVSKKRGAMHACGHDGHMAMLLSAAKILTALKGELRGKIIFIFEEAEENGGGIEAMLTLLTGKGIDGIYGTHLTSFMDTGQVSVEAGPVMAAVALVEMTVHGKGGHGSRPDLAVNPIFAGAQILNGIASAWNNQLDVEKTVTLGLTQLRGGEISNVIPDTLFIGGTLRYFDVEAGMHAYQVLQKVAEATATAHDCSVTFSEQSGPVTIPLVNDPELAVLAQQNVKELYPEALIHDVKWYASESFSHYARIAPAVFAFVGTRNELLGSGAEHHNEKFDLDEASLAYGIGATVGFAIDFLQP